MSDLKKLFFFFILSLSVLVIFDYLTVDEKKQNQQLAKKNQAKTEIQNNNINNNNINNNQSDIIADDIIEANIEYTRDELLNPEEDIKFENSNIIGSISKKGAVLNNLILKNHFKTINKFENIEFLSPRNTDNAHYIKFGWISKDRKLLLPNNNTVWNSNSKQIKTDGSITTLSWDNKQGQKFYIHISLDEGYLFNIKQEVKNYSDNPVSIMSYGLINKAHKLNMDDNNYISHQGAIGFLDNSLLEIGYDDVKDDKIYKFNNQQNSWLGIADKFWLSAIIPAKKDLFNSKVAYSNNKGADNYQFDYITQETILQPNEILENNNLVFAGVKEYSKLQEYQDKYNIPLFDRSIDFGILHFITKPMFILLDLIYEYVKNFGLSIIFLTILVKIILFPLANKSYTSFAKMKKLTPQLIKLKEIHKSDKMELNKAMMKMYKNNNVNPMSGCLPILLQIPIFFALYKVLYINIEMRHAPFYLWIKDLSAPDPTSIINFFGLMPWDPFIYIGVLPVLMSATMIIQQKLNPPPTDPLQASIVKFIPYIFLILFASFPSGLVLYWVCNNTLSILQQWFITVRINKQENE